MDIYVGTGIGTGPTKLSAFDAALNQLGVPNYNLIKLSSIIPPGTTVHAYDRAIPSERIPGKWGDKLYVVMAEHRTDVPFEEVWAGVGWVQNRETGRGLFAEHEGSSEAYVRSSIQNTLQGFMATRQESFGPIEMKVVGVTCSHLPVCAMVVAVYQAEGWGE